MYWNQVNQPKFSLDNQEFIINEYPNLLKIISYKVKIISLTPIVQYIIKILFSVIKLHNTAL